MNDGISPKRADPAMQTTTPAAAQAANRAARLAYGRLIATLCQRGVDIAQAEDALGDAFVRALDRWSSHGVPDSPDAWLLTAARRILIDEARHAAVAQRAVANLVPLIEQLEQQPADLSDRRLSLMMLCAHPKIPANARAPLMLQTVLGLTAKQMSSAFLVSPAALGQRLARAKHAIRRNKLSFNTLDEHQPERLGDVLEAVYAAFSTAYESVESAKDSRHGLAHEAIWLGQILAHDLVDVAEVQGLLSLMLFVQSRVNARRTSDGKYAPLSAQNRDRWNWQLIARAEHHLGLAAALKNPGRFQLEAAIQSHHIQYDPAQGPDWNAISVLYDALVVRAPTVAAWVGRAAAIGEARGVEEGLTALGHIPTDAVAAYQPYWAVKAHLLGRTSNSKEAQAAYSKAIGLCEDAAVREFLRARQKNV